MSFIYINEYCWLDTIVSSPENLNLIYQLEEEILDKDIC